VNSRAAGHQRRLYLASTPRFRITYVDPPEPEECESAGGERPVTDRSGVVAADV
jgi:hypothetical protein